jgi:hypothetical protein
MHIIRNPAGILCCQLGLDTKYSIWDAEAAGVVMALWLLRGLNRISHLSISIYSDSQAFLKVLKAQHASPGYHLIRDLVDMAESLIQEIDLVNRRHKIKFHWIAAHKNVRRPMRRQRGSSGSFIFSRTTPSHLKVTITTQPGGH